MSSVDATTVRRTRGTQHLSLINATFLKTGRPAQRICRQREGASQLVLWEQRCMCWVEAYYTVEDMWQSVGKLRVPRHGTYAVGVGKRVYIPGGGVTQSGGPVAEFDVFLP
jgi:hypothetical protein